MEGIVVGTSSWSDPGFVEEWYPEGLAARDRLAYYAERFDGVEVNATWYAIPSERTVARWVEQTPEGFTFDVKLHRLLTRHSAGLDSLPKDLRDDVAVGPRGRVRLTDELQGELVDRLLAALTPLREAGRLACLLAQLSPAFAPRDHELDELAPLVDACAPHPLAIELRHRRWLEADDAREATIGWMREHRAVLVGTDGPQGSDAPTVMPPVTVATHPEVAYLRAHGRNLEGYTRGTTVAERFAYDYPDDELRELNGRARSLAGEVPTVRLMLNNNRGSDAPRAATRARELLGQDPPLGARRGARAGATAATAPAADPRPGEQLDLAREAARA